MSSTTVQDVLRSIDEHQHFVLTSHARPDGDAVGSLLACHQLLKQLGKSTTAVLSDGVPLIYRPLPLAGEIVHASAIDGEHQAALILECDSLQRTRVKGLEEKFLINIDHHASAKPFADINWIELSACAVAEMVYRLIQEANAKVTPEIATCLYTAILTDTGSFCYESTTERTFKLAQELVRLGAHPAKIAQNVYFSNPTSKMRLLGAALSTLNREGSLAWMHVTDQELKRSGGLEEDLEGLVNYALGIEAVEVAVFFRELPDHRYRVSLRSKGGVNVAEIAERFGGGGHACASGFSLAGPLARASEQVLAYFRGGHKQES